MSSKIVETYFESKNKAAKIAKIQKENVKKQKGPTLSETMNKKVNKKSELRRKSKIFIQGKIVRNSDSTFLTGVDKFKIQLEAKML